MKLRSFFQMFDLALGQFIALVIGAIGAGLLYVAWHLRDGVFWIVAIGCVLILLSVLMVIWRITFFRIIELFSDSSWN